jgi:hypothetical protein
MDKTSGMAAPQSKIAKRLEEEVSTQPDLDAPLEEREISLAERYWAGQARAVQGRVKAVREWNEV